MDLYGYLSWYLWGAIMNSKEILPNFCICKNETGCEGFYIFDKIFNVLMFLEPERMWSLRYPEPAKPGQIRLYPPKVSF